MKTFENILSFFRCDIQLQTDRSIWFTTPFTLMEGELLGLHLILSEDESSFILTDENQCGVHLSFNGHILSQETIDSINKPFELARFTQSGELMAEGALELLEDALVELIELAIIACHECASRPSANH